MQGTHDIDQDAPADNGETFDPHEAARVLADARREAQRELSLTPPLISVVMGAIILGAYVALWLSTHDQHPYKGPSLGVGRAGVRGGRGLDRGVGEGLPARDRRGQRAVGAVSSRIEGVAILISSSGQSR